MIHWWVNSPITHLSRFYRPSIKKTQWHSFTEPGCALEIRYNPQPADDHIAIYTVRCWHADWGYLTSWCISSWNGLKLAIGHAWEKAVTVVVDWQTGVMWSGSSAATTDVRGGLFAWRSARGWWWKRQPKAPEDRMPNRIINPTRILYQLQLPFQPVCKLWWCEGRWRRRNSPRPSHVGNTASICLPTEKQRQNQTGIAVGTMLITSGAFQILRESISGHVLRLQHWLHSQHCLTPKALRMSWQTSSFARQQHLWCKPNSELSKEISSNPSPAAVDGAIAISHRFGSRPRSTGCVNHKWPINDLFVKYQSLQSHPPVGILRGRSV